MKLRFYKNYIFDNYHFCEYYETAHNRFDCPKCSTVYAETSDQYLDLYKAPLNSHVECGECGAKFVLVSTEGEIPEWEFLYAGQ
jgi:uncharacterized Zn-finger protein